MPTQLPGGHFTCPKKAHFLGRLTLYITHQALVSVALRYAVSVAALGPVYGEVRHARAAVARGSQTGIRATLLETGKPLWGMLPKQAHQAVVKSAAQFDACCSPLAFEGLARDMARRRYLGVRKTVGLPTSRKGRPVLPSLRASHPYSLQSP